MGNRRIAVKDGEEVRDRRQEEIERRRCQHPRILRKNRQPERSGTEHGNVYRVVGVAQDMTERRRVADELKEHQEHLEKLVKERTIELEGSNRAMDQAREWLQTIIDKLCPVVFVKDVEGRHLLVNTAYEEATGVSREHALGKADVDIFPRDVAHALSRADKRAMTERKTIQFEEDVPHPDGVVHKYLATTGPLISQKGEVYAIVGTATDITEQKTMEGELRQAMEEAEAATQAKSAFLANMSHELRTPLNAILGFSQLMFRDEDISTDQRENLRIINESGGLLLSLINDVLNISRIESGQIMVERHRFDLRRMLATIEEMGRIQAEEKGLQFRVEQDQDLPRHVKADERKLCQILINLLGNAVKFTDKGCVTLRVGRQKTEDGGRKAEGRRQKSTRMSSSDMRLCFEVADTGTGIASEALECIFHPFVQTSNAHRTTEGTGLGLAISREYARLLGGDITVRTQVGTGSCFSLTVPLESGGGADVEPGPAPRYPIRLAPDQPRYRILVAEDQTHNRLLLSKWLESVGFEIRGAINGQEAVELFEQWHPHLILMDMRMPDVDGYEATQRIVSGPNGRKVIIIAVTADVFAEEEQGILAAGCHDLVRKPISETELFEKMTRHLGVRFTHEPGKARVAGDETHTLKSVLTATALKQLPEALLGELEQAAHGLGIGDDLVARIQAVNAPVGNAIAAMARDYQYTRLLELIQR